MKQRLVYVNGEMVPEEEARISIFDSAVLIGDSVIETARTFHRQLFRWPEHRDRLLRSIKAARMSFGLTTEELDRVTQEFLEENLPTLEEGDEGGVGHLVSRGRMGLVLPPTESTFVMYFYPLSPGLKAKAGYYDKGLHVVTPPTQPPAGEAAADCTGRTTTVAPAGRVGTRSGPASCAASPAASSSGRTPAPTVRTGPAPARRIRIPPPAAERISRVPPSRVRFPPRSRRSTGCGRISWRAETTRRRGHRPRRRTRAGAASGARC